MPSDWHRTFPSLPPSPALSLLGKPAVSWSLLNLLRMRPNGVESKNFCGVCISVFVCVCVCARLFVCACVRACAFFERAWARHKVHVRRRMSAVCVCLVFMCASVCVHMCMFVRA